MTYSAETLAAISLTGLLVIVLPVAAVIVFKLRCKDTWLPSALIGAGTFLVFVSILENLCHSMVIPLIKDNTALYCIYGAPAAGIFEETGRFVAYKTLMKKRGTVHNAVMMGLGHGGFEAILLVGITMLGYLVTALTVNAVGYDSIVEQLSGGDPGLLETVRIQLEAISEINMLSAAMGIYERILAMALHVCLSVVVFKSAAVKGKLWLYPAAILIHALFDLPAVLYQVGAIPSLLPVHLIMTVLLAATILLTVKIGRKKDKVSAEI